MNTIKFVGIQDPAIQATATGQYTGTSASGSVCTLTASMAGGNGTGGSGGGVNFNCVAHNSIL